jgi:flagellar biosynthesis protein FliR
MYEHHSQPLLPIRRFIYRFLWHAVLAFAIVAFALGIGIIGYHYFEGLSWLDSFLNASMILGGMGEIDPLHSTGAKLFAGFYALFAGLVFIAFASILVLPVAHRLLHILHLEGK